MRLRNAPYVAAVCGIAILYYVAGRLGLLLAIPPGYATAVWPPSGIALAGLLLFGPRIWPGVLVGSFALNVWTSLDPADPSSTVRSVLVALAIAIGSTLQARFGERLVRGISGEPASKPWEGRRAAALALGGPLACLTAATVGTTTLVLAKAITPANYFYSWSTWYVGDTIGVVIFTPILLLWATPRREFPIRLRFAASLPLAVTFGLVVFLFTRVNALEQQQVRLEFERRAGMITQTLQRGVDRTIEAFRAVGDSQDGLTRIDRARFRRFTLALLARHPEIQAISWDVRVPHSERAALERDLRREGQFPWRFTELDAQNKLVASRVRKEYVVVRYIEPYRKNRDVLAYDVASNADRRKALSRARDTGEATCTVPIRLIQGTDKPVGCMVFLPMYWKRGSLSTTEVRAEDFAGAFTAFIRLGDLMESLLEGVHPPGVQIAITDPHNPGRSQWLYDAHDAPSSGDPAADRTGLYSSGVLTVAGHRWKVAYAMTQEYLDARRPWQAWGVLAAGMAFTGLLGAYILDLLGRSAIVERLVTLRTDELRKANEEAKSAQLQLAQAAKMESIGRLAAGVAHEVKNPLAVILFALDYLAESIRSPDPNVAVALSDARGAVLRADAVTRALLDFSTGTELKPSVQDVNEVLRKALYLVRHALTKSHIQVVEELESGLPPVVLDQTKIEQVLVNLLVNAVDAMPDGGTLVARTHRPQVGGSAVVVEIEDTGTGIEESSREKLFDPFFTTKPPGKGTGLGLAVSKSIVALHGGAIGIANREGGGARATVVLRSVRPKTEGNGHD